MTLLETLAMRELSTVHAVIRKKGSQWCVYSERTGRSFGCYSSRAAAHKRLAQIEMFKNLKSEGGMGRFWIRRTGQLADVR